MLDKSNKMYSHALAFDLSVWGLDLNPLLSRTKPSGNDATTSGANFRGKRSGYHLWSRPQTERSKAKVCEYILLDLSSIIFLQSKSAFPKLPLSQSPIIYTVH